ncbi:hypothetical protein BDD12DRAFT_887546 [Trichophaea hybrida]|nr:hypothetical protein BDD12DRAFT_887546 [Trichophaea hybrida]
MKNEPDDEGRDRWYVLPPPASSYYGDDEIQWFINKQFRAKLFDLANNWVAAVDVDEWSNSLSRARWKCGGLKQNLKLTGTLYTSEKAYFEHFIGRMAIFLRILAIAGNKNFQRSPAIHIVEPGATSPATSQSEGIPPAAPQQPAAAEDNPPKESYDSVRLLCSRMVNSTEIQRLIGRVHKFAKDRIKELKVEEHELINFRRAWLGCIIKEQVDSHTVGYLDDSEPRREGSHLWQGPLPPAGNNNWADVH